MWAACQGIGFGLFLTKSQKPTAKSCSAVACCLLPETWFSVALPKPSPLPPPLLDFPLFFNDLEAFVAA